MATILRPERLQPQPNGSAEPARAFPAALPALSIECTRWKPHRGPTVLGWADLRIPELRPTLADCTVLREDGRLRVRLSAKPLRVGGEEVRENGKRGFVPVLRWDNGAIADAFSAAALDAIRRAGVDL